MTLTYGTINEGHFDEAYLRNPDLLDLTRKIVVKGSEEANRRAPEAMLCKVEVLTHSGQRYASEVAYHKGHYKNPLTDAELEEKFHALAGNVLSSSQANALLDCLWHLEDVADMGELLRLTQI